MIDQAKASKLAKEAFELWQAGRCDQSELLYEEAIGLADPQHWGLPTYLGQHACLLNVLGKHDRATAQFEKSLAAELAQGNVEGTPTLTIARYFLANQLLRQGEHERALETLAPSIQHAPNDWLTRAVEAHILFATHRKTEAKAAASLAISNAPTPAKAEELKQDLQHVFKALED